MVKIQLAFAGTGTAAKDTTSYVICLFVSLINGFIAKTDRIFHWSVLIYTDLKMGPCCKIYQQWECWSILFVKEKLRLANRYRSTAVTLNYLPFRNITYETSHQLQMLYRLPNCCPGSHCTQCPLVSTNVYYCHWIIYSVSEWQNHLLSCPHS